MDQKFRVLIGAIAICGIGFILFRAAQPDKPAPADAAQGALPSTQARDAVTKVQSRFLPETLRNQGIEEIQTKVEALSADLASMKSALKDAQAQRRGQAESAPGMGASSAAASMPGMAGLDSPVSSVDWTAPGVPRAGAKPTGRSGAPDFSAPGAAPNLGTSLGAPVEAASEPDRKRMQVWPAEHASGERAGAADAGGPVIPVNSALESVMLSGINARPSGSIGGAVGSVTAANNVGAPFVTRIKGDAILPNGWKLSDIGDCFLGGSGIAVLSTERAYVIADNLSCVAANGEVYEAPIKAYGLDVDGTLGIAGKVVSKQGALLLQAALTGMASGLGAALAPTSIPAYNSNAVNGSTTGLQFPNPAGVAQTAVGQGINQAASQLSKFYLDYAKETFPVVEVVSGTRVTWVLKESVELKRQLKKVATK
jgi:conjugal transfer pilus assembly protein TraB